MTEPGQPAGALPASGSSGRAGASGGGAGASDRAETLLCQDLDRAIALFARLGLRLDTIFPADDPAVARLSGPGAQIRLVRAGAGELAERLGFGLGLGLGLGADLGLGPGADLGLGPGADLGLGLGLGDVPATRPSYVVVDGSGATWRVGRAGMQYRDLIPDRQGGRYIASHIQIPDGGPVPDYVHHHAIEFQIIYCYKGWVRVVYEDQGEPFVMQAGECVLQPPGIRHRVLEASPGLEVIELGAPAVHATHVDHELALPTAAIDAARVFGGQRFVRYQPARATFDPAAIAGFEASELGVADATAGVASVRVLRVRDPDSVARGPAYRHDADLLFHFVLRGQLTLDATHRLGAAAAFVVPAGQPFLWREVSPDLELLQVALPGTFALDRI